LQDRIGEVPALEALSGVETAAPEGHAPVTTRDEIKVVLQALARTVQSFRQYPHNSPICTEAVRTTQTALLRIRDRDHLAFQVSSEGLHFEDEVVPGHLIESDLGQRLHLADVSLLEIDRDATPRDISLFSRALANRDMVHDNLESLNTVLTGKGVGRIKVTVVRRLEVVRTGEVTPERVVQVKESQRQREIATRNETAVGHLFTPETGWIRLDPGLELEKVEIADLALLVNDPPALASALHRLSDESGQGIPEAEGDEALVQKFSEVARLYASYEPSLLEGMFKRLAKSVLGLDPERRQTLLRNTILPGLLDDTIDGSVMRHFPDPDIAESLSLLLDLQIAAPEVLSVGLERLQLDAERVASITPLLAQSLKARREGASESPEDGPEPHEDQAGELLKVDGSVAKDFSEFAAFDLSVDERTADELSHILGDITETDPVALELGCHRNLLRITADPDVAETVLERAQELLLGLETAGRLSDLALWAGRFRDLIERDEEEWGAVSKLVLVMLTQCCSAEFLVRLVTVEPQDVEERLRVGSAVVAGFGPAAAASGLRVLEQEQDRTIRGRLVRMFSASATSVAPYLAKSLNHSEWYVARNIVVIVGFAGEGYEELIEHMIYHPHPKVTREAFISLNRIGTGDAAGIVMRALVHDLIEIRQLAREAIWRFEPHLSHPRVRTLLGQEHFVHHFPNLARRLIESADERDVPGLAAAVEPLKRLRFRFWRPKLRRLGACARKAATP
jgi:hypothetical protein